MYAAVFATSKATVTLQCGSSSSTTTVNPGVTLLKLPLAAGKMTVKMVRNGQTIINQTPPDYTYNPAPTLCTFFPQMVVYVFVLTKSFFSLGLLDNYNAWVGCACKFSIVYCRFFYDA